jgi:hypothetical protein
MVAIEANRVGYSISICALYCYVSNHSRRQQRPPALAAAKLARWAPRLARVFARCWARVLVVAACVRVSKYSLSPRGCLSDFCAQQIPCVVETTKSWLTTFGRACLLDGTLRYLAELWICRCSRSHIVVVFDASCLSPRHERFPTVATWMVPPASAIPRH